MNRRQFTLALGAAALAGSGGAQAAEAYPSKPIHIYVMYPPGGGADSLNRVVADRMSKNLGQAIIIDNRPGGAGVIATRAAMSAPADGYTLLHAGAPIMTLAPKLVADVPYSPDDFIPVAGLAVTHYLLIARSDFPANNLKELVALAKQKPGSVSRGNWGQGSITHVLGEMLDQRLGIEMVQIPYRGEAPLTTDLLGGQVPLGWLTLPAAAENIKAGKFKAFGMASPQRVPLLPEVPTFIEQGLADFSVLGWSGWFVVKGTPPAIVERLHIEVEKAVRAPEVTARLEQLGLDPFFVTPTAFGDMIRRDNARMGPILDTVAAGIKN